MALNLPSIISGTVKTVFEVTRSLQETPEGLGIVAHHPWTGADEWGHPTYSVTTNRIPAIYEQKAESKFDLATGAVIQTRGKLTILELPPANGTPGRMEPIDNRDLIILPDGSTGPIYKPEGLYNPVAGRPFLIELWIGA